MPGFQSGMDLKHHVPQLAVLIDADNVSDKGLDELFLKITELGNIAVKRIYGDFTSPHNSRWKEKLCKFAIRPISQFANTSAKNASDCALIVDAMDLLYTGRYDGFCIVSSDSDFTALAMRIREEGLKVYGFGKMQTPEAFRNACHQFSFLDVSEQKAVPVNASPPAPQAVKQVVEKNEKSQHPKSKADDQLYALLKKAVQQACSNTDKAHMGAIGQHLQHLQPGFNVKNYQTGKAPLTALFRARPDLFEVTGKPGAVYVKIKK